MDLGGVTWIVAADATEARFFAEPMRAGAVHELPELHLSATGADAAPSHQRATVHERAGPGRHGAGDESPGHEAARRFLSHVASRLADAAQRGQYDRLVIMAPPTALGVLRQLLPPAVASRVDGSDPHERKHATAEEIREHLHHVRARS